MQPLKDVAGIIRGGIKRSTEVSRLLPLYVIETKAAYTYKNVSVALYLHVYAYLFF